MISTRHAAPIQRNTDIIIPGLSFSFHYTSPLIALTATFPYPQETGNMEELGIDMKMEVSSLFD
jgi:hypothetical protein